MVYGWELLSNDTFGNSQNYNDLLTTDTNEHKEYSQIFSSVYVWYEINSDVL